VRGALKAALGEKALSASIDARLGADLDLDAPLDIYALCGQFGIAVRFVSINMEGMYAQGAPPQILISALRPLARRAFTCAHELGHHVFGHGSTIDELTDDLHARATNTPDEFLVQSFAGFLLMPTLGVRKAFVTRGWSAATATPIQMYTVACSFGVGYTTLINHLAYALEMLPIASASRLQSVALERVRREILGFASSSPLLVVDRDWSLPTVDAEVGTQLLLPPGVEAAGTLLAPCAEVLGGRLFDAIRPGIARAYCPTTGWTVDVRISRFQFVGLSRYRHLEEVDDDD
jgi:hypothetical protein